MTKVLNLAKRTLDGNWRVETERGTRWYSTLKELELELDDPIIDMPGGLKKMADAWRELDRARARIERDRKETLDALVRTLIDQENWSRADVAHFLGKTPTVVNRSLLRSDPEASK